MTTEHDDLSNEELREKIKKEGPLPGMVYSVSEPEYFGSMPIRQELETIPNDDKVGWTIENFYSSSEVLLFDEEEGMIEEDLVKESDLYHGVQIVAPTLFGHVKAVVLETEAGLHWESESGTYGNLIFAEDNRKCWTTSYAANKKSLKSVAPDGKRMLPVIQG